MKSEKKYLAKQLLLQGAVGFDPPHGAWVHQKERGPVRHHLRQLPVHLLERQTGPQGKL